jgi:uncharacterized protein YeaO (DUF488 family)
MSRPAYLCAVGSGTTQRYLQKFERRYKAELARSGALDALRKLGKKGRVTLLYAAHDPYVNHAVVLKLVLQGRLPRGEAGPRARR